MVTDGPLSCLCGVLQVESTLAWAEVRVRGEELTGSTGCIWVCPQEEGCGPWKVCLFLGFEVDSCYVEVVGLALVAVVL